jgi:wyosine [tRNA(Phe)-imidazoG37] synthetase (radical SAM superfamily)
MGTKWRHLYGPAPSRRLGRSLGVDPIPFKTCNWNCIYCQLGRTSPLTTERAEYIDADELVAELRMYLQERGEESIDWITFVGSGEPTLHSRLGWMIREAKRLSNKPVAVITNGALLGDPQVCEELLAADAVLPTISAGTERTYLRLHRPAHGLGFDAFVEGLVSFRDAYHGKLWAEVMLVAGLNDTDEELEALRAILVRVRPDEIQIVLPERPPSEPTAKPAPAERVERAARVLGAVAKVTIASEVPEVSVAGTDLSELLVGLVRRHPMTEDELFRAVPHFETEEVSAALAALIAAKRLAVVDHRGRGYYTFATARYKERPGCR